MSNRKAPALTERFIGQVCQVAVSRDGWCPCDGQAVAEIHNPYAEMPNDPPTTLVCARHYERDDWEQMPCDSAADYWDAVHDAERESEMRAEIIAHGGTDGYWLADTPA